MTSRDYIKAIHIRYGVLFNKSTAARGSSSKDKSCHRGCGAAETLNHILQSCYSTHTARVKRHDAIVNYVHRVVQDRGMSVHKELQFRVGESTLKPDLVVYNQDRVVVDVQIVNDQFPLEPAYCNKIKKYLPFNDQLAGLQPGGARAVARNEY